jgi:predicted permease
MSGFIQDARYALRSIRRELGFFTFAALVIGLGVGANTAVFSVMSPLMLRPLPFEEPDQLAWIALNRTGGMSSVTSRTSNLRDYRTMNQSFEAMTGYFAFFEYESYNLTGDGNPERLVGVGVARNFLEVLGVQPHLGRNFAEEESIWDGRPAAILTHGFWMRRFGGDPAMVGRSILLNDVPTEVVGVLPSSFDFASTFSPGSRVDLLRPFPISDETDNWGNTLSMIGRLRPGSTIESAQADLDVINQQLREADPDRWGLGAVVTDLRGQIAGDFRAAMLVLAAAAGAVMLIACANLSNLLLARGPSRHKEMAVRSALGADRGRLLRQLMIESLVLALCGGVFGVGLAFGATRVVAGTSAIKIPMLSSVGIDGTALLFTFVVALSAGVLIGIVPALQVSRGQEARALNDSSRGSSEGKRSTSVREVLVVAEVATACVLLVGGGLLLRSFVSVLDVDLGFEPRDAIAWRVDTNRTFENSAERIAFYDQLIASVEAVPGVERAGLTDTMPLGRNRGWGLRAKGVVYEEGEAPGAFPRLIDHRYIQAMQIPLVAGRYFTADDSGESAQVIIINQAAAERLFPGQTAVGRIVLVAGGEWEVVGVVADVRHQSLEQGSGLEMYLPIAQIGFGTLDMVVRSPLPPESLIGGVRSALRANDPDMPTDDFQTLDSIVDRAVSPRRFILALLGAFAGTALLLAALGIYGVLSYSVSQRIPEIGIRMALGESANGVRMRVVSRTIILAGMGIVLGAVASFVVSRLIQTMLFGVEPADPLTFAGMAITLLTVSGLAGYLPARRASRTDPIEALRAGG